MSFWGELRRRNVFKVGAAYVIVAWLIIQAVVTIFPTLNLPSWSITLITVLLIIGLPLALVFTWAFELIADGVKRVAQVPQDEVAQTALAPTEAEQTLFPIEVVDSKKALKTIAVLPFADLSAEKDQEYFVDGLSEELLNSLTKIQELRVIARTSSFVFKGTDKTIQEIADVLGANYILEGSVRKAGNSLRITAQLIRAEDGIHLWSEAYNRMLEDIFAIQEDISTAVADELKVTFGIGKSPKTLGGTENVDSYNLYLACLGQNIHSEIGANRVLPLINTALELDPKFALAWALKARIHLVLVGRGPANRVSEERDEAIIASQKAIELEPNLPEANVVLGMYKHQSGHLVEAELAFRKVLDMANNYFFNSEWIVLHYMGVGHLKKSLEISELLLLNDPFNKEVREWYIINFSHLGNMQRAEEENKRAKTLLGDQYVDQSIGISLAVGDAITSDEVVSTNAVEAAVRKHLDSPQNALTELRHIYYDAENLSHILLMSISEWAAYFGDPEFAMEAMETGLRIDLIGAFNIWGPVMHDVRQLPRFKEFVREIGLVEYWEKYGWPDLCKPTGDGDFVCD